MTTLTFVLQHNAHSTPTLTYLLQYSTHSALTYSTVRTVRSLTVHCALCAHLHYSAHSAPTLTYLLQYCAHIALSYSTVRTARKNSQQSTVRTVTSLTSAPQLTSQYSAHSAALAPTMSSVFQHILHGSPAQRATTFWQFHVLATLLNFKLITCFPAFCKRALY